MSASCSRSAAVIEAGARSDHDLAHPAAAARRGATRRPSARTIIEGLLRGELGFDGVVVSDALDMKGASGETGIPEAAVLALAAGCDLLCIGTENTDEQLAEIEDALVARRWLPPLEAPAPLPPVNHALTPPRRPLARAIRTPALKYRVTGFPNVNAITCVVRMESGDWV